MAAVWKTIGRDSAALAAAAALLALLAAPGCSRDVHSVPGGRPDAGAGLAANREAAASLADRQAWVAALASRGGLGPGKLADLGRRGFFEASLCPAQEGTWTLDPGRPLLGYRVVWSCPECKETSPGDSVGGDLVSGGSPPAPTVPPVDERPWPAGDSPVDAVARDVAGLLERWGEEGHPLARVRVSTRHDDSLLTVELDAHPGPRVSVSGARFEGNRATRPGYLLRLLGWRGQEPWRTERWETARSTLLGTGLFDEVDGPLLVRGVGEDTQNDSLSAEVLYRLRERRVNSFTGLIGYSGRTGNVSGFVNLELGNLFGTGRRARVAWQAQRERESRFELAWHEPFVWRLPLAANLGLTHVLEDTLYAETNWGFDLVLAAGNSWDVTAGWSWGRLVVGGDGGEDRQRQTARFGVRRSEALGTRASRGWELGLSFANTQDGSEALPRGLGRVSGWGRGHGLMLLAEEQGALVAGVDSVLRGDALSVGGAGSLRGYFEGAYRATRYLVQRLEVGPAPSGLGPRFYALLDLGWLREWRPGPSGLAGTGTGDLFRWSAGLGLQAPSRAGDLRLDYAVPGGEPIYRGRIHLGLVNRF